LLARGIRGRVALEPASAMPHPTSTVPPPEESTAARTYVLLGGSGGIGAATARRLAAPGVCLALGARDEGRLATLASELAASGARVHTGVLDATLPADVDRFVQEAAAAFDRIDGIANFVGSILIKPAHTTTDAELETTLRLNLWSAFGAVKAAAKVMRANGGSVVLMSTGAARSGLANHEAIAAAKAGVEGLAVTAAATYATNGIRVNAVAPGLVNTGMAAAITGNEMALKASIAMHALGRIGEPEDVAPMVAWLLGAESSWVTGQVFGIDGGLASVRPRVKMDGK